MSINDSSEKINPVKDREGSQRPSVFNGVKQFFESEQGKDILTIIIVILVGLGSFELGRLSKSGNSSSGVKIEYPNPDTNAVSITSNPVTTSKLTTTGKGFFASNKGSKYYPMGCTAGNTLKQENRIYFSSSAEAEQAGYELSSSCK